MDDFPAARGCAESGSAARRIWLADAAVDARDDDDGDENADGLNFSESELKNRRPLPEFERETGCCGSDGGLCA